MTILAQQISSYLRNSSWIRRMFEAGIQLRKQYGNDAVCDFSLGNPDLPAPPEVGQGLRALADRAGEPFAFGYMPNGGFPWARAQLAEHLSKEQGIALTADHVILTCGAAGGLNAFFRAVLNPGDEVLTFAPYFVEYGFYVANAGGSFRTLPALADSFAPDLAGLKAALNANTRVILINSPHNPTGTIYSREELEGIIALLHTSSRKFGHPIWLVADEPYRFLAYDGVEVPSVLGMYPYAIAVSSFSKNLSLPGERLGYVVLSPLMPEHEELMAALTLCNRILGFVNPPVVGQHIMAAALGANVDVAVYKARRDAMAAVLERTGYTFTMPAGAFYFFPKAPGGDDIAFVNRLQNERVLAVPGSGFGYPGYFRLAFCVEESIIYRAEEGFRNAAQAFI